MFFSLPRYTLSPQRSFQVYRNLTTLAHSVLVSNWGLPPLRLDNDCDLLGSVSELRVSVCLQLIQKALGAFLRHRWLSVL